ncbi:Calcipressin [Tuber magnatum]|uniref:Calcipressin n=1 Tax=Tuber magnatum TaxID=42249 RepID=A0A317ST06_9PEZI|nr:Calcipressin [Tuber magnatum]
MESPKTSPAVSPLSTPNRSRASSRGSHLTLDLSSLPPLIQSSSFSNFLFITLFSPLSSNQPTCSSSAASFRRIVCSFATEEDAISVRQVLDGEAIVGDRARVYFGEHTPVQPVDQHLQAPESKKLFFISPPPSPPRGWELRNEGPPNAVVVAEDLAQALARLDWVRAGKGSGRDGRADGASAAEMGGASPTRRPRSASSVVLFEPEEAGDGEKKMPAISVDDYTDSGDEASPVSPAVPAPLHTARPPVELIQDA